MAALKDAQQPDGLITALLEHANVMMRRILCRKGTDAVIGRAAAEACGRLQFSMQFNHIASHAQHRLKRVIATKSKLRI